MRSDTLKKFGFIVIILLLTLSFVGCKDKDEETSILEVNSEFDLVETFIEENYLEDINYKKIIVEYVGAADSHTFEVKNREEFMAFQYDSSMVNMEQFKTGDIIDITYYVNENNQNIATEVVIPPDMEK